MQQTFRYTLTGAALAAAMLPAFATNQTLTTDLVVIGAGASGTTAAWTAAEKGLNVVTLLPRICG